MGVNPVLVAVDGGGSKTDVVALGLDGSLVARVRGGASSPQGIGLAASVALVESLVLAVADGAPVRRTELYLSGLDLPRELGAYSEAIAGRAWARQVVLDNDLFALLRAGTAEPDAVAVVCGTGMNAVGVRADGASVRFPALGQISGDWGGGSGLGSEALWHAARDEDGRGPHTALTDAVRERFGPIPQLIEQLHFGERSSAGLAQLAPAVFELAATDVVAAALVDRQAAEVVAFVTACLKRLELLQAAVPVVLGGGILQAGDQRLMSGIAAGLDAAAPHARIVHVTDPPILGAARLVLEHAGIGLERLSLPR
ncbi:MAG TPA: BadF/BadG/BcrA/BcrD ATPase family protein [Propionicimonas sp.]|uniref:N-acetylglucosamine kinase n=1 Tax=Propionicimonas sp. TaxID=1955623 RepID=UPI002F3EE976